MNKHKKIRLFYITALLCLCSMGVYLILSNLEDNIVFFYPPSEIDKIADSKSKVRVGGLVVENSIVTVAPNKIRFDITDYKKSLTVEYTGILPALFREKQGIVGEGKLVGDIFIATKLLAKHDENYMPPEIASSLRGGSERTDAAIP